MHKAHIKIYGDIFQWNRNSAESVIAALNHWDREGLDVINIHVHCVGGDVMEGNAIYNAIRACKTPVDIYVDGVAASMMTIVMLAARRVYMSENAFLMVHAPSGNVSGTAQQLEQSVKLLHAMEANFKRVYAAKTGKTEDEVGEWLNGVDNWFSAQDAFKAKLIDGVVDKVDVATPELPSNETQNYTETAMFQRFVALSEFNNNPKPNKDKKSMNKQEVIARFNLTSVTVDSSEADIYAAIEQKIKDAESKSETERESLVTSIVQAAIDDKKLTEDQKADFVAIGTKSGVKALQTALAAIKTVPSITSMINGHKQVPDSNEPKTFTELQAMGDTVVAAWRRDRPQDYARLYKAEFGHDINP